MPPPFKAPARYTPGMDVSSYKQPNQESSANSRGRTRTTAPSTTSETTTDVAQANGTEDTEYNAIKAPTSKPYIKGISNANFYTSIGNGLTHAPRSFRQPQSTILSHSNSILHALSAIVCPIELHHRLPPTHRGDYNRWAPYMRKPNAASECGRDVRFGLLKGKFNPIEQLLRLLDKMRSEAPSSPVDGEDVYGGSELWAFTLQSSLMILKAMADNMLVGTQLEAPSQCKEAMNATIWYRNLMSCLAQGSDFASPTNIRRGPGYEIVDEMFRYSTNWAFGLGKPATTDGREKFTVSELIEGQLKTQKMISFPQVLVLEFVKNDGDQKDWKYDVDFDSDHTISLDKWSENVQNQEYELKAVVYRIDNGKEYRYTTVLKTEMEVEAKLKMNGRLGVESVTASWWSCEYERIAGAYDNRKNQRTAHEGIKPNWALSEKNQNTRKDTGPMCYEDGVTYACLAFYRKLNLGDTSLTEYKSEVGVSMSGPKTRKIGAKKKKGKEKTNSESDEDDGGRNKEAVDEDEDLEGERNQKAVRKGKQPVTQRKPCGGNKH